MTMQASPPRLDPARAEQRSAHALPTGAAPWWATAGVLLVVSFGVFLRLYTPGPLWLDEAISTSISSLPIREFHEAPRRDGGAPLAALLLWGWERLFGDSPFAVRSLAGLIGIAALPVAALAGHRLAGRAGAVAGLLLLASSPFAIYQSTQARMYSLTVFLVLCGFLVLDDYLRAPSARRGVPVAVLSAALALTHYWAFFLLAVTASSLLIRARRMKRRADLSAVGWMAAGGLLFLPWLPTFIYQLRFTGTPWGLPEPVSTVLLSVGDAGVSSTTSPLLSVGLLLLATVGVLALPGARAGLRLDLRGRRPGRALAIVTVATLLFAAAVSTATGQAFTERYTAVVFPLLILLAALGVARLPAKARTPVLVAAVLAGLSAAAPNLVDHDRTQAGVIADALRTEAQPGDVVLYCPDQLGPAVSRLLPPSLRQEVYPTAGSPARVDWVNYSVRNRSAVPSDYVMQLVQRAGDGVIWVVSNNGYRTYEGQCEGVVDALNKERGTPLRIVEADRWYFERAFVQGWAPQVPAGERRRDKS